MTLRTLTSLLLLAGMVISSGCAMCCGVDDYTYGTYGGKWERTDRTHGRVGSAFSDGQAVMMTTQENALPEQLPAPGPDLDAEPIGY